MSIPSVGKEITAYCGKCKLALAHVVASMRGINPDKVVCSTCKSEHKFKDPSTAKKKKKTTRKRKAPINYEDLWQEGVDKAKEFIPYSPRTKFVSGDCLEHSSFGKGIVEKSVDSTKIHVLFREGYKTLMHNR